MVDPRGRAAFEKLVLPHLDAAYNVARHLMRADAEANDVVQEALLRAWRYFDSFRGTQALPWLLQIVRNSAYAMLERRQMQPLPDDLPMAETSTPEPAAALMNQIDGEILKGALDALPTAFREVIVLRELEGLSYKEIAAVTGTSIGTVMSRISRGRQQLQTAVLARVGKEARHDV